MKNNNKSYLSNNSNYDIFKKNKYMNIIKDKTWQNPNCRIIDTKTGNVLKEYGTTIIPT